MIYSFVLYNTFCCVKSVDQFRRHTSIAAFQSKLKGSCLSWYDPGQSVIITRFLLSVILLPQILIPANEINAILINMSTFVNSVNGVYVVYLLLQCGGWCFHRCWAPLSQRRQWLERSHHEKHSLECKILQLKPCLKQKNMHCIFIHNGNRRLVS